MTMQNLKLVIGNNVPLKDIESAFRKHWRNVVDSDQAVMKASTLNLIVFTKPQDDIEAILEQLKEVIEHHPGRVVIAGATSHNPKDQLSAQLSACALKSDNGQTQISAEFIVLNQVKDDRGKLAGAILPLLLPDVPVFFWCADLNVLTQPDSKSLLQYTDRLILQTPAVFESLAEYKKAMRLLSALQSECNISDLIWSELTDWREAIASLFDSEQNRQYLNSLFEIEIVHGGSGISNQAWLLAGWLTETLKGIPQKVSIPADTVLFQQHNSGQATVKITRQGEKTDAGVLAIKLVAEAGNQHAIFTAAKKDDGAIATTVHIGDDIYPETIIGATNLNHAERLCDELDFVQQDETYVQTLHAIIETLNES